MNRDLFVLILALVMGLTLPLAAADAAGQGPDRIDIYGGKRGKVPFPHAKHQATLKDCNICHGIFPQKTDAIKTLKDEGAIKPKKVMNQQCIKCHRKAKRAGQTHGPVTCATCHIR
jgi:hypothetical protein